MGIFSNFFKSTRSRNLNMDIEERGFTPSPCSVLFKQYGALNNLQLTSVFRAIHLISTQVANLPLMVYKTDSNGFKKPWTTHSAYDIICSQPNHNMSRYQLWQVIMKDVLEKGTGYAYIQRNPENGQVTSLTYLKHEYVTPLIQTNIFQEPQYKITAPGFSATVPACSLIIIKAYTPDGYTGISPLSICAQTLNIAKSANQTAEDFFKSGGNPNRGFLSTEKILTPKQKEELVGSWVQANASGVGIPVLQNGIRYEAVSVDPQKAEILPSRRFGVEEVARIFNCSASDLGEGSGSYNSLEQRNIEFLNRTLMPYLVQIEQELSQKCFLGNDRRKVVVCFLTEHLLRGDKSAQSTYVNKLVGSGCLTVNEARKLLDMPAIDDKLGNVNMIQSNFLSLENAIKATQGSNVSVKQPNEDKNTDDNE